jgi:hypothetical protein
MDGAKLCELLEEFVHKIYTAGVASRNSVS